MCTSVCLYVRLYVHDIIYVHLIDCLHNVRCIRYTLPVQYDLRTASYNFKDAVLIVHCIVMPCGLMYNCAGLPHCIVMRLASCITALDIHTQGDNDIIEKQKLCNYTRSSHHKKILKENRNKVTDG